MNNEIKHEPYTSPKVDVIEMDSLKVMCSSTTGMPVDDEFNF